MPEIRMSALEMAEMKNLGESFVRIMLKEKGLPMTGIFYPELKLNEYHYFVWDDRETGEKVYKYEKI